MQVYVFSHDPPVKPGCCNWETSATYWMAEIREQAEQEIAEETPEGDQPHGLCSSCMMQVLTSGEYRIRKVDE